METLLQDLRYGLRMLARSPAFTAVALITLALGIGANTALFSIVNGVLLNPLPFPHPDQLITLGESKPNFEHGSVSYPNFLDWQKENHSFSAMATSRGYAFSLTGAGEAEQLDGEFASFEYFHVLGVKLLMGRAQTAEEDQVGANPVVLISAGLWQRKFSSAPDILGKLITLDGKGYTVIGVVPASFHLFSTERQVYVPIGQWNNSLLLSRGAGLGFHGIGRLKPDVTLAQARADMTQVTANLATAYPDIDKGRSASLIPLKQLMVGDVQPFLVVLLVAVGFVLLIACVNVANLLLARSTSRAREFAVRAALGASQQRVIRQLLTESVLLAVASGTLGLLLAAWGTRAALGVLPSALPRAEEIGLDSHVLIFTVAISLLAGILFGLAPARRMSRTDLNETLKEGGRGGGGVRHRAQGVFVVVEMATALVLLIGAGLMIRSLAHLWEVDPGFNASNVLTFGISLPPAAMNETPDGIRASFRDLNSKLAALPNVTAVSQTWGAVPMGVDDEMLFWRDDQPKPASNNDMSWAIDYIVDPDYLKVMEIPLQKGRFFSPQDNEHSPQVVVVDDEFARKYFSNEDPIGKRIHLTRGEQFAEIIGVVRHVKQWGLDSDDTQSLRAQIYVPCMQMEDGFLKMAPSGSTVVVRSAGAAPGLFDSIRHASQQMSSQQVVFGAQSMEKMISQSLATQRFSMILLGVFAGLALLLASVGIYGVISYVVGQRTREIGIRMALGAERRDVLRLIVSDGGKLTLIGIGLGVIAALGLTRLMAKLLFGVSATDPVTFAGVAVLLALVALTACYIPARRAAKVDPMVALRYE